MRDDQMVRCIDRRLHVVADQTRAAPAGCPVEAVKAWRQAASIAEGARYFADCGIRERTAPAPGKFRRPQPPSGLVTTAVKRGVNLLKSVTDRPQVA
jgi:hypothetical protein